LASAATLLRERCVQGIQADVQRCKELLDRSTSLVTALVSHIGYEKATEVAVEALSTGETVQAVVLRRGLMPAEALAAVISPEALTKPGVPGRRQARRLRLKLNGSRAEEDTQ
ncbi:MAG: hypothetical protein ACUVRO_00705, partial [Armatimonadota bacterium]